MNNFLFTTAYLSGLAWFGAECMMLSASGSPVWFILFFLYFVVGFVVLGCLDISNAAIYRFGAIFTLIIATCLAFFTVNTLMTLAQQPSSGNFLGHWWFGILKALGLLAFLALTLDSVKRASAAGRGSHKQSHA